MFDISFAELIIIVLIGLIFVAPKNLPILARVGGKVFQQVKIENLPQAFCVRSFLPF